MIAINKEELKITKEDLALWLDRPPSNDDLDLCAYLEKALENQHNYYQEIKQLQQEKQQLMNDINKLQKELNEENLQCSKYAIEFNDQKEKNKQLKDNWNKLTEYIDIKLYNVEYLQKLCGCRIDDEIHIILDIIKKEMKELEGSDSSE